MAYPVSYRLIPLAAILILAGGCAGRGPYPSLAPRPIEQLPMEEPVRDAPPVAAPDPALEARIGELRANADEGKNAFDAAFDEAEAKIGAAGAAESESWVEAQQALSRLEAARTLTTTALAELDQLRTGRAALPTNPEQATTLAEALVSVEKLAEEQQSRIDGLRALLASIGGT